MPSQDLESFAFKRPSQKAHSMRSPSPSTLAPLPMELSASQVRPVVYRILSKKYALNLKSSGLELLADYMGRKFGKEWRTKSELFLDQIGRRWKEQDRGLFVDRQLLQVVIREVELRSASFTASTTTSVSASPADKDVEDSLEHFCPQEFFHVWDAFTQPRWTYNRSRKHFERGTPPSLFPSAKHQVHLLASRYHLLHHRILRNDEFQPPSFYSLEAARWHAISQIKNLLGRHGKSFLLLALLVKGSNGNWWAEDPSGRLELDLGNAVAGKGYFLPGCILLLEGIYSRNERFLVKTIKHPPCETREKSREAFGYVDLMGIGGIGSTPDGRFDRAIETKMMAEEKRSTNAKIAVLGCDLYLDQVKTFDALAKVFEVMERAPPMTLVMVGSFISLPLCESSGSSQYKDQFDQLAQLFSLYPKLCSSTTVIFVPGNNDPWESTASAGGPVLWPQRGVPEIFTNQVRRIVKKTIWASNPCRICYFSQEIIICRDNLYSRLHRNSLVLNTQNPEPGDVSQAMSDTLPDEPTQIDDDLMVDTATQVDINIDNEQLSAEDSETERMVQTVLDQGHISPWSTTLRPIIGDYEHALSLIPLPTAIFLCDPTSRLYTHSYMDCRVMNPSVFVRPTKRRVEWIEFDAASRDSSTHHCLY